MKALEALRERLGASNVPVFYVSDKGSLTVEFGRTGWRVRTAGGETLFTSH
jgi:beta-lactamase superfamily II metal-dependent hydrolase